MQAEGPGLAAVAPVIIMILAFLGILALLWLGWRHRVRLDADIPPPPPVQEEPAAVGPFPAIYVSTIRGGHHLERIHAHTLGERSYVRVTLTESGGVRLERKGAVSFTIPFHSLRDVGRSSGQAGKYLGPAGLRTVTWSHAQHTLVTALHFDTHDTDDAFATAVLTRLEEAQ